jgi:PAT family beta-lactamase induction signal transducer AmpG
MQAKPAKSPWQWVPSLYFAEAVPYVMVMTLSVALYKELGIDNDTIAFYTSLLYLPWVIKPLWSPLVELVRTRRWWIVTLQGVLAAALAGVALALETPAFFFLSLAVLWVMAFSSATHDIAADGFYMLGLKQHQQAAFVGVRSTFYRLATIVGGGAAMYLAGQLIKQGMGAGQAWSMVLWVLAAMFGLLFAWHALVLPRPVEDVPAGAMAGGHDRGAFMREFLATFAAFFKKRDIWLILGFILTYRLGESQLLKLAIPFLKDPASVGGLGLSTDQVGLAYSTVGILALTAGGLLGGWVVSRIGLKRALWPMVFAVHLPDLVFVYLAYVLPQSFTLVTALIALEQFGYGFGFTAMLMYMIMVSEGPHKTAHYAICTGFMALGMMLPGMVSGRIQQMLGYQNFFVYVFVMTIPAFIMAALVRIDPEFGKKQDERPVP